MDSLDDDKRTCVQICEAYLQAIASEQSPERTAVIDGLNQSMMETTGYTCEELGIDANAYADWALSNFSYRIDSCYTHRRGHRELIPLHLGTRPPRHARHAAAERLQLYERAGH